MRVLRFFLAGVLSILLLAAGALAYLLNQHQEFPAAGKTGAAPATPVRTLFLGTSSMAWTDGKSTWLVDGFFSRQSIGKVILSRLSVDENQVNAVAREMFNRLDMPPVLAGIVVAHSHYDHSLDAPYLVKQHGGRLIGSDSTAQIAQGQNLSAMQIDVVAEKGLAKFGDFRVELRKSAHAPTGFTGGFNTRPVSLPAHALSFKEGTSYSFLVSHPLMGDAPFALIQPSAGYLPGQNSDVRVQKVFLGTGGLGKLSNDYIESYWQEMVINTGAKHVYLIHWDDFTQPLMTEGQVQALKPMPGLLDDFPRSLELLTMFSSRDGVKLEVVDAWQMVYF